jgi:hypothetical protein
MEAVLATPLVVVAYDVVLACRAVGHPHQLGQTPLSSSA